MKKKKKTTGNVLTFKDRNVPFSTRDNQHTDSPDSIINFSWTTHADRPAHTGNIHLTSRTLLAGIPYPFLQNIISI